MALDPLEELTRLPQLDVSAETAARIRHAALVSLRADSSPTWAIRFERFWTSFVELPSTALVVIVYLVWAVQAASGTPRESQGVAMEAPNGAARLSEVVLAPRVLYGAVIDPRGRLPAPCPK